MLQIAMLPLEDSRFGHTEAYQLLKRLYEKNGNGSMPPVVRTRFGRPYWENSSWHFSISHTKNMVACALSDSPVGLDCETIRSVDPKVLKRILGKGEREWVQSQADPNLAFLQIWTMKEAYGKYTGKGLGILLQGSEFQMTGKTRILEEPNLQFFTKTVDQCVVTCCTEKVSQIQWEYWETLTD